jgi:hypothetical protein
MKRYTSGASLVMKAVQSARDPGSDYVWLYRALVAIVGLSVAESVMARALCDDAVWGMRQDFLRYTSGDPQYQYLRSQNITGFRPAVLAEKAEAFATTERAAFVFERHLAMALKDEPLAQVAANGQALVDRVSALEGTTTESLCFVLMPFRDDLKTVYTDAIKPAAETVLRCERADEIATPGVILEQIDERIQKAQVIVADITGSNPNVTQEIGYARALQKLVILLAQEADSLPFDVRHFRVLRYTPDQAGLRSLRERLTRSLAEILK